MGKVSATLTATLCALLLSSCQGRQAEQNPTVPVAEQTSPVKQEEICVKEEKVPCIKPMVDTICDTKTGQWAEIRFLNENQYDSLLQQKKSFTLVPEELLNRDPFWDRLESDDTSQFNLRLDSVMGQHPFLAEAWQKRLDKVVQSNFDQREYYRPNSSRDVITEVYHFKETDDYLLNIWTEHTAYGFWLNEKSSGDSLLLITSHFAYNGTYLAGELLADCDYCADIHFYRRNEKTLAIEECLNYLDHDITLDLAPLHWVGLNKLLCKGCKTNNTNDLVFVLISLL